MIIREREENPSPARMAAWLDNAIHARRGVETHRQVRHPVVALGAHFFVLRRPAYRVRDSSASGAGAGLSVLGGVLARSTSCPESSMFIRPLQLAQIEHTQSLRRPVVSMMTWMILVDVSRESSRRGIVCLKTWGASHTKCGVIIHSHIDTSIIINTCTRRDSAVDAGSCVVSFISLELLSLGQE